MISLSFELLTIALYISSAVVTFITSTPIGAGRFVGPETRVTSAPRIAATLATA